MYVHLINDEKFLMPFMRRAADVTRDHLYIVFGPKPPYQHVSGPQVIHSSEWEHYSNVHDVVPTRIYIHLLTYQKVNWVKRYGGDLPVYWMFYGNDLYELLQAFKGFSLYEPEDRPRGLLANVKGEKLKSRAARYLKLAAYHRTFGPFVRTRIQFWCFWNTGDFELLRRHYRFSGTMLPFQYGAFNPEDVAQVQRWVKEGGQPTEGKLLLNHSGSQSGNHKHILTLLKRAFKDEQGPLPLHIVAPLSYGDREQIGRIAKLGPQWFGEKFEAVMNYMDRAAYFDLICSSAVAVFGHRRQEAGNTLFIALMSGTKVFMHPNSVLLPFLKEKGYAFWTLNELDRNTLLTPLTEEERSRNFKLASLQFSEETIGNHYVRILT